MTAAALIIMKYGINNINWEPYYDIYLNNKNDTLELIFKGKIYNNTDNDIINKNIKLVLDNGNLWDNNQQFKSTRLLMSQENTSIDNDIINQKNNINGYKNIYNIKISEAVDIYKNSINYFILFNLNNIKYTTIYEYELNNNTDIENNVYVYGIGKNTSNEILPQAKYNIYDKNGLLLNTGSLDNISINQQFDIKLYKSDFIFGKHNMRSINFDKKKCNNNFDISYQRSGRYTITIQYIKL